MCVLLIKSPCGKLGGLDHVNRFNHTRLVAIVTPTDRPKSVHNRFNQSFRWRFCVVTSHPSVFLFCFLECSVDVRVFVIRLSKISSFLFTSLRTSHQALK